MAGIYRIIPLVLLLSGCGSGSDDIGSPVGSYRAEVMSDLGLTEPVSPMDAAIKAREFLYAQNSPVYYSTSPTHKTETKNRDRMHAMYVGIKDGSRIYVCDGLAYTLKFMMEEIGLQARVVVIGNAAHFGGPGQDASHVIPEVLIDGRWVAVDPLFNTTYHINGGPAVSMAEAVARATQVTWQYGTATDNPERTIEYYYGTLDWMLAGWRLW